MNEGSGYLYAAFHQVIDPILKRFTILVVVHTTYNTIVLPTWVEWSKDTHSNDSWSASSFPTIIYLGTFIYLFFLYHPFSFFHGRHIFIFTVCAEYMFVTDTLNINYYGTTFGGVSCSYYSLSGRMHVWPE